MSLGSTHVILLCFLPHVEVDHGGDRTDLNQEQAFLVTHLGELQHEGEVLRQVLTVRAHTLLNLDTNNMARTSLTGRIILEIY